MIDYPISHSTELGIPAQQLNALRMAMGKDSLGRYEWPPRNERMWQLFLSDASAMHSLWNGGMLVGYGYTTPEGSVCKLQDLIIHPDHRGRGLGKLLAEIIIDDARRAGFDAIYLTPSDEANGCDWRKGFYGKLGFSLHEEDGMLRLDL